MNFQAASSPVSKASESRRLAKSRDAVRYVAAASGEEFAIDRALWCAPEGGHLNLSLGYGLCKDEIETEVRSLWRYAAGIRVGSANPITLGEGWTPLVKGEWGRRSVSFKLEYVSPTGSFKDRGTSVLFTYLQSVGVNSVLEDSSGNAGASMAAYAGAGGLNCRILVPASAPKAKIAQIAAMGAEVQLIPGSRQDVATEARRQAEKTFYASHNWQPFFLEGTKTLAFELWEQLDFTAPDAIVVPLGYGSNVLGLWLGFNELLRSGAVERIPRIYAVQAENCAPFRAAWVRNVDHWVEFEPKPTIADGIASLRPVRMKEVLSAISNSGGSVVSVSESEIVTALGQLAHRGLFIEPTSAAAGAALTQLQEQAALSATDRIVMVLTGSGLKSAETVGELLGVSQTN
jgi:threonine synthase